jgi:hypothetical protein
MTEGECRQIARQVSCAGPRKRRIVALNARFVLTSQSQFRTTTQNDLLVNSRRDIPVNLASAVALAGLDSSKIRYRPYIA